MKDKKYFEDIVLNQPAEFGDYLLTEEEIIDFAGKWDPQPFHLDHEAAKASVFGGMSACSAHNFSIMSHLLFERGGEMHILAGLGTESMKFMNPSRPGDHLRLRHQTIEKRESRSRPDAGIVKSRTQMLNQNDEVILDAVAVALVAKKTINEKIKKEA